MEIPVFFTEKGAPFVEAKDKMPTVISGEQVTWRTLDDEPRRIQIKLRPKNSADPGGATTSSPANLMDGGKLAVQASGHAVQVQIGPHAQEKEYDCFVVEPQTGQQCPCGIIVRPN